jgi:hypothetical protein
MTKSEKAFLERYVDNAGTTSNVTTIEIAVSILAREFLKSAIKKEEKVELEEPIPYESNKRIFINEDNLMNAVQILEDSIKRTKRTCNSFEQWDEEVYNAFRDFRNIIYRTKESK